MKKKEWQAGLDHLDPVLVEDYVKQKEELNRKKEARLKWRRIGTVAACLLLVISAAVAMPFLKGRTPSDVIVPTVPTVTGGSEISGNQRIEFGDNMLLNSGDLSRMAPGFYINTVIHAKVIEVLPDRFSVPGMSEKYLVARLSVIEEIRGNDLPEEIFLRFPFYSADIFNGYESFILSLEQIGVENYMMINESTRKVNYFSHMFTVEAVSDLGYGSVIAFNGGKVDTGFFEKADHFKVYGYLENALRDPSSYLYPVGHGTTVEEAKTNILELAKKPDTESMFVNHLPCDFITAEDIFISDEGKEIRSYLAPSDKSVFMHELYVREDRVIAEYTRVINGFPTDEKITLNGYTGENGNVLRSAQIYTDEDLASIPDIGLTIASLDLSSLTPPHTKLEDGMILKYSNATGVYRKANGKVYGIVRILWHHTNPEFPRSIVRDDCYYLYDQTGNGKAVERNVLKALIGNDPIIMSFKYNAYVGVDK